MAALGRLSRAATRRDTRADDLAIFQYTSGTTRELPDAVKHTHRSIVTLMLAALYGTGIRPGDRFFCPSSPAWGHGLWHGTLAPLALGVTTGAYAGKFDAERLMQRAAGPRLHQHLGRGDALPDDAHQRRGGGATASRSEAVLHRRADRQRDAALRRRRPSAARLQHVRNDRDRRHPRQLSGRDRTSPSSPARSASRSPACSVEVQDASGTPCAPGETGEIKVWRRGDWLATKDLGRVDEDGYFYHGGRADDVIISAGWTMSAVEIEDAILKHPDVREAAAIGVPDALRGQVVKAFVVSPRAGDDAFVARDPGARAQAPQPARISRAMSPSSPSCRRRRPARSTARSCASRSCAHSAGSAAAIHEQRLRRHVMSDHRADRTLSRRSPMRASTICASASACKIEHTAEPWCYEATRDNIRHYAHGIGDDNPLWCDPGYAAKTQLRRHRRAAELPVLDQPHRLGLRRRPARRARHVVRRRLDAGTSRSSATTRSDRGPPQGPGRARDALRRPCHPADLPRRLLQPARRPGRRGRQLVLPHRARPRARAGHASTRRCAPAAPRRYTRRGARARPTSSTRTRRCAAHAPLLGGREGRRRAAGHGQGPDDRHRLHRLRAGLGRPLHPRQQARLEADRCAPGPRHQEPLRHSRRARARALGGGLRARGRRARRLRLRPRAQLLADPPPHQLDGRRRLPAQARTASSAATTRKATCSSSRAR